MPIGWMAVSFFLTLFGASGKNQEEALPVQLSQAQLQCINKGQAQKRFDKSEITKRCLKNDRAF